MEALGNAWYGWWKPLTDLTQTFRVFHLCTFNVAAFFFRGHPYIWHNYCMPRLSKTCPPIFLHTTLRQKWRGVCSNIPLVLYIRSPIRHNVTHEVNSHNCCGFLGNSIFTKHVLQGIRGVCVDSKPTGIEATSMVSGDRGRTHISYSKQWKPWR